MEFLKNIQQWVCDYISYSRSSNIIINNFKDHIEFNYPEFINNLNTIDEYTKIRDLLVEWGIERFFETETLNGIPIFKDGNNIESEFTFFKNIESPDGDFQNIIPEYLRNKFAIVTNIGKYNWNGANKSQKIMEKGNMSIFHQFLILRNTEASLFNALTLGLNNKMDNKEIYDMLCDMEVIANLWAENNGIPQENLGCYFHIYPFNSIQSLHMHMVDTRNESHSKIWKLNFHKNLSLHDLQRYFHKQI